MSSEDAPISFHLDSTGTAVRGQVVAASPPGQRPDAGVEMAASRSDQQRDSDGSTRSSRRRASDLPDLRPRLVSAGVYEDYINFRTRYLNWRRGSHSGATGELTDVGAARRQEFLMQQQPVVDLVDTPQQFNFFYTTSYWVAIWTTVGSLVLSFTNISPLVDRTIDPVVMKWLLLLGDIFFTLSTYAKYFELINLPNSPPNSEGFWFVWLRWSRIVGEQDIVPESAIGIAAYLLGMIIWDVAAVAEFWEWEGLKEWALIFGPRLGGGICFMIGGVCEVIHNRDQPCWSAEWIAAIFDFLGCVGFLVGVFCALVPLPVFLLVASWSYALGILGFLVGGVFFIVMWRSNDFGLTLLRQLNDALRAGGPVTLTSADAGRVLLRHGGNGPLSPLPRTGEREEEEESEEDEVGMSVRGVVVLTIYCWLLACSSMNVVLRCYQEHYYAALENGLWMMTIMLVLIVHSAITVVPNRQPYWLVAVCSRGLLTVVAGTQTRHFLMWLPRVA